MATCFWDLGFDLAAVQDNHTLSFLQNGPVGNVKANIFSVNDTLTLNVFKLTANASQNDGTQILTANVSFQTALSNQAASTPFDSPITTALGTANAIGFSAVFNNSVAVPRWTGGTAFTIASEGKFLFTVALTILGPGTNNFRTFVVDPEMIVQGPAGGQESPESSDIMR